MDKEEYSRTQGNKNGGIFNQASSQPINNKQRQKYDPRFYLKSFEAFVGGTKDMLGNVFQTHSEQKTETQFEDTMEALKTYDSQKYVKHIELLTPLSTDLKTPQVDKPTLKQDKKITVTMGDGTKKEIYAMDEFERKEYRCEVKTYAKESAALKTTMRCSNEPM